MEPAPAPAGTQQPPNPDAPQGWPAHQKTLAQGGWARVDPHTVSTPSPGAARATGSWGSHSKPGLCTVPVHHPSIPQHPELRALPFTPRVPHTPRPSHPASFTSLHPEPCTLHPAACACAQPCSLHPTLSQFLHLAPRSPLCRQLLPCPQPRWTSRPPWGCLRSRPHPGAPVPVPSTLPCLPPPTVPGTA